MTEQDVINLVGDAIGIPGTRLTPDSTASDFAEWDSMGMLSLAATLDSHGIALDPGEGSVLQSLGALLGMFRRAGKLA
ncbi:MAG: hypothetical protein NTY19_24225 [Planctomycetota bacterium]|nr:hypothetical protein [Planctomycetota bacterium]